MADLLKISGEEEYRKGLEKLKSNEQYNLRDAHDYFLKAAEKQHAEAMLQAGYLYLFGEPQISRNEKEAVKYFKNSAEAGLAAAKFSLAACYLTGVGVEKDEMSAVKLFEESYNLGYYMAAVVLYNIFISGYGTIEKDVDKAIMYNNQARQANVPGAEIQFLNLIVLHNPNFRL